MDISETLAPNSDQLDAIELIAGPRTFTIAKVAPNNDEQPVNIYLAEFPRVWRPGKSMRRVLAAGWGTDASKWAGRRLTLYYDPNVKFGGSAVGGTRISHMSHIDKPLAIPLPITRGKTAVFKVQPLPDLPAVDWAALMHAATSEDELRHLWQQAKDAGQLDAELNRLVAARRTELTATDQPVSEPEEGDQP